MSNESGAVPPPRRTINLAAYVRAHPWGVLAGGILLVLFIVYESYSGSDSGPVCSRAEVAASVISNIQSLYDNNQVMLPGSIILSTIQGGTFKVHAGSIEGITNISTETTGGAIKNPMGTYTMSGGLAYNGGRYTDPVDPSKYVGCAATLLAKAELKRDSRSPTRFYDFKIPVHYFVQPLPGKHEYNTAIFGLDATGKILMQAAARYPD